MKIYQVDAFTDRMFSGNPAGVCILSGERPDTWMRNVAAEMNLSETAFLGEREGEFDLRWFTPKKEVDLCGHATLASAHILWETGALKRTQEARFRTKSGLLKAMLKQSWINMDFPSERAFEADVPEELTRALKVDPVFAGRNRMDYIIEVGSEDMVWNLEPDIEMLKRIDARGVIVTSRSHSGDLDFISRFFAPAYGIPEDPVTGSAHCCLGPYWETKLGKKEFTAYQASKRGGTLKVRIDNDRVILSGQAVTVFEADLRIGTEVRE